jgi:hypothetical protein
MRSTTITAATIAAAAGLTVTDVTTLDDDALKRTGGRT